MRSSDLLADAFGRLADLVHQAVDGASAPQLVARLDPEANTIAWLVWHLTRVQDDHVADVAGVTQRWVAAGWADRFGLPLRTEDTGYGHDAGQVAAVQADAALLTGYADDVCAATVSYVRGLSDEDLDRVVDEGWDPPVTLGVRLVSVLGDDLQHIGQAAFTRGLLRRRA